MNESEWINVIAMLVLAVGSWYFGYDYGLSKGTERGQKQHKDSMKKAWDYLGEAIKKEEGKQ